MTQEKPTALMELHNHFVDSIREHHEQEKEQWRKSITSLQLQLKDARRMKANLYLALLFVGAFSVYLAVR